MKYYEIDKNEAANNRKKTQILKTTPSDVGR